MLLLVAIVVSLFVITPTIKGIIKSNDGNQITATVILSNLADNETEQQIYQTETNREGEFSFSNIKPGVYFLSYETVDKQIYFMKGFIVISNGKKINLGAVTAARRNDDGKTPCTLLSSIHFIGGMPFSANGSVDINMCERFPVCEAGTMLEQMCTCGNTLAVPGQYCCEAQFGISDPKICNGGCGVGCGNR